MCSLTYLHKHLKSHIIMKVYLIGRYRVDEVGRYKKSNESQIFCVYTNMRLANKAVDYLNKEWREAFETKNFKEVWWYCIRTLEISKFDYSKLTF